MLLADALVTPTTHHDDRMPWKDEKRQKTLQKRMLDDPRV